MTQLPIPPPPAHLAPFVRILGADLAIRFLLTFGGAELYLAVNPQTQNRVVEIVGTDLARILAEARLPRRVPTGKPWIARVWRAQGLSVAEIARNLHAADVSVRRWLDDGATSRQPPVDHRQLPLL